MTACQVALCGWFSQQPGTRPSLREGSQRHSEAPVTRMFCTEPGGGTIWHLQDLQCRRPGGLGRGKARASQGLGVEDAVRLQIPHLSVWGRN